jgi:putative inorganic carbon (HCO3(-)) transporter
VVSGPKATYHTQVRPLANAPYVRVGSADDAGVLPTAGMGLLLLFLFLSYSRLTDTLFANQSIVFVTSILALAISVLTGGVQRAVFCRVGIWLCAFTVWLLLAVPFSFWRGGSVEMLSEGWLKSFLVFLIVAGLPRSMKHCRMAVYSIALAAATIVFRSLIFGVNASDRLAIEQGVLSNPNSLAQFVLMGLPFVWLMGWRTSTGVIKRVVVCAIIAGGVLVIARTGSRGGLLAVACLVTLVGSGLSIGNKMKFVGALLVIALLVVPSLSEDQRLRYMTLFGGDSGQSGEVQQSAIESRQQRLELLKLSLRFTATHPIFGVGPGVFEAYAADVAEREGRRTAWQVTHNMYTQISAEAGIPALIFYLGAMTSCLIATRRIYKAPQLDAPETANLAYALHLSIISFAATAFFDSIVYQIYFPTLAGLTVALIQSASIESVKARQELAAPVQPMGGFRFKGDTRKPLIPA